MDKVKSSCGSWVLIGRILRRERQVPQARQSLDKYSTVEKQFAFIRTELAKRPYRVEIEYDDELGYRAASILI